MRLLAIKTFTSVESATILAEGKMLPMRRGLVYTAAGQGLVQRETYDCEERFPDASWILRRLTTVLAAAQGLVGRITVLREKPRLLHYQIGGHFIWHQDAVPGTLVATPARVLTGIIHLSNDFLGGELDVEGAETTSEPGIANLFPAVLRHRLRPITRGERWALVFWGYDA